MKTLTNREKNLLKILGVIVILIGVYYLLILPIRKITGQKESVNNDNQLEMLDNIYRQYKEVQQKNSSYTSMLNRGSENITTKVEQWANTSGIARNLTRTTGRSSNIQNKYVKQTTDIKIEGVAIQDFLKFLYEVEYSDDLINVSQLRIRSALKGTNTYDINIKIENFTSNK